MRGETSPARPGPTGILWSSRDEGAIDIHRRGLVRSVTNRKKQRTADPRLLPFCIVDFRILNTVIKYIYYTDFADHAPQDTVILTLGCGKYRFNRHDFGTIGGLPRLLDMGQCNDAYSAIVVASKLAEAFGVGVNELPLSLIVSWFEQKAAAVLLTLLALGINRGGKVYH